MNRRYYWPLAILVTFAVWSCRDAVAPPAAPAAPEGPRFSSVGPEAADGADLSDGDDDSAAETGASILQQAATAPPLETYHVAFWLSRDKATQVIVRYRPAAGESEGQPFLLFDVPKGALRTAGGGAKLAKKDSILITMTIDPASFLVDFQPSGVLFTSPKPATLVFWYQNAEQDLNGDGVVNGADRVLLDQLRIIYRRDGHAHWHRTRSMKGWTWPYVFSPIRHFSSYAVSW
ncbi:MAG TPA: hypothetical protein VGU74_05830 [Gemmatimonadales bacterium]|nr:hypothetical protein [Gemmatimonadales bacterium]